MKKIIAALVLTLVGIVAYAGCTTHTYSGPDGRLLVCTTCCYSSGNCHTFCN